METAEALTIVAAGVFFLVGLLSGVWKYIQIANSEDATAHPYVDICHRASLLYAFASILLLKFLEISQLPGTVELVAVAVILFYFASAIGTYMLHGLYRDTENQLQRPFRMAGRDVSGGSVSFFMWTLAAAEIGGFLVIFYGVLVAVL